MAHELEQYNGKKVVVVKKNKEGGADEIEGTVQSGNELGLLVKLKGKTTADIIEAADIVEVRYVVDAPKALERKVLKVVEFGQARNHLLERHGFTLAQINAMDEKAAFDTHNSVDHVYADLGHEHGDKKKTERVEAVDAAGESADD